MFTALSSKKYLRTVVDGEAYLFMRMFTVLRNDMRKVSRLHISFIVNFRSLTYSHVYSYVQQTSCIRECSLFGSLNRATRCMCGPIYKKLLFILAGLVFVHSPGIDNSNTLESGFEFCEGFATD